VGFRWAFNDVQGTPILGGPIVDLEHGETIAFIEGERRVSERWVGALEMRWLLNTDITAPLHTLRKDDFLTFTLSRFSREHCEFCASFQPPASYRSLSGSFVRMSVANFRLRLCQPLLSIGSNSASFSPRPHQFRMRCLEQGSASFPGEGNTQASPSPGRRRLAVRSAPAATCDAFLPPKSGKSNNPRCTSGASLR
jgi:hypothetical protein